MLDRIRTLNIIAGLLATLSYAGVAHASPWQASLEGRFDIVDTFDDLEDWTPGAKWFSGSGCATCLSNTDLPKKQDGTPSIWGIWNNKGLSFQYTPQNGTFVTGDVITGASSGATATVRRVWNLDGKWYIQLTNTNATTGTSSLRAGESITSGTKSGTNLQWPLFIGNHGPAYTWGGAGKSLVLDLGDNSNTDPAKPTMAGLGAQRLGTYFGDGVSGGSGYKKVHVFFMMKISPTFFLTCPVGGTGCVQGGYDPVSVVKVFDLMSGFTGVSRWGTAAEAALAGGPNLYRLNEYGQNFSIFNFAGGGLSFPQNLFFSENTYVSTSTTAGYDYTQTGSSRRVRDGTGLDIEAYVKAGEWFGAEVAVDIGTKGLADGSTDFWIYDKAGREMGHFAVSGENRLMNFDHRYNKFVFGGNRLSVSGGTADLDSRWWVDDLVIHGSRIGTSYFQMLSARGTPDPVPEVDTLAPTASIVSPTASSSLNGITTVSANATDNVGVTNTELYVDGVLRGSDATAPFTFILDTKMLANGAHSLSVKAYDAVLNVGTSALVPVTVSNMAADATGPTVTAFVMPATAGSLTVPITMFTASDNAGVTGYLVTESSTRPSATAAGWSASAPLTFNFSATGVRTAFAWAKDAAGNVSFSSKTAQVIVDDTAPVITALSPNGGTFKLNSTIRIAGTATDAVGLSHMTLSIDSVQRTEVSGGSLTYSWRAKSRGTHTISITAYDRSGNRAVRTVSINVR